MPLQTNPTPVGNAVRKDLTDAFQAIQQTLQAIRGTLRLCRLDEFADRTFKAQAELYAIEAEILKLDPAKLLHR